ncbi:hypothetical protein SAMN05216466_101171 [Paraburkholderia phenazinium]|uniref:Uncharacterized protein n=1 Tax=Paraburkholderia phenazinium TaxID=60549 RepID=A0A1G7P659_9BURK|nr:hypothetical protein [Paraburkholderia phenazinium]SDF81782.1 hypothetical protein SAMN05216466_101171 [Paraburkholderia phenazinium]
MSKTAKTIVEDVLSPARTRELWTANYLPALPFTPQGFEIGALLPAMLYMARWGHRRGKGAFRETFGLLKDGNPQPPSTQDVAAGLLSKHPQGFVGFEDKTGLAQLADLLLSYCLENKGHEEGHESPVQRIFATHYLSSHVDLPESVAHLRGVPELLTALLSWTGHGEYIEPGNSGLGRFVVGDGFQSNPLLKLFARHMSVRGTRVSDLGSDNFDEAAADDLGIDELLAARIAQACGHAPEKARGRGETDRIPNRWPIADAAAKHLRGDLMSFIEVYGQQMPRQAFLPMLEAGIALGLTNILLSTTTCLFEWERCGRVPREKDGSQAPWSLFVDASLGQDKALRGVSESVMSECAARYERVPVILMQIRLLDERARFDRKLKSELPSPFPDARPRLDLLGALLHERHERADSILKDLDENCQRLAEALTAAEEASGTVETLQVTSSGVVQRLAQALVDLIGDKQQGSNFRKALDDSLMTDRPNGLAIKRRVQRTEDGRKRSVDLRAIVLTNPMLDFLVHRHLRKDGKGQPEQVLSLKKFLEILRLRYGLYVDREPPGISVPQDLLRANKLWLERRLRDLGLLVGVNDAESMKQLRPRFEVSTVMEGEADAAA